MIKKYYAIFFLCVVFSFLACSRKYKVVSISMEKSYNLGQVIRVKKKFGKAKRNDIVTFKNPSLSNQLDLSRVLGLPGETLELNNGHLYINGHYVKDPKKLQLAYLVTTDGTLLDKKELDKIGIIRRKKLAVDKYEMFLTLDEIGELQQVDNVTNIEQILNSDLKHYDDIFPHNKTYNWNRDNFGPIKIPKKGEKITITFNNVFLYLRILNEFEKSNDFYAQQFIDDVFLKKDYVFKYDYFMVMSDNRAIAMDSRHWGFIPKHYILGKVKTTF
ncbi:MAG: signal peptidase I [Bacteroidota bacterium]